MKALKTTLPNGIRLLTVPFSNMESATVTVWVSTGARHETDKVSGLSHFLEHMVFKGSSKRPTAKDISEAVDSMGAEFNAGTSKEWTNFYIKSRVQKVPQAFDVLSDMVLRPILREEDIEREKGVILEEISMYEDTPAWKIGDVFEQLIFKGSSLGRDVLGSRNTVKAITKKDFDTYRASNYTAGNMLITVSGGIKEDDAVSLSEKYFGDVPKDVTQKTTEIFQSKLSGPKVLLKSEKKEQAHMVFGYKGFKRGEKTRYIEAVLASILGGGMSSRLFTEIREKRGLAYSVRTRAEHYVDTGYLETYAGVDVKRVEEAVSVLVDQTQGLRDKKYKIKSSELKRAKEYIKGHLALSLEDTRSINHFFGEEELLLKSLITPEEVYKGIEEVTEEDVYNLALEVIKPDNLYLAVIGPYETSDKFEKLISK